VLFQFVLVRFAIAILCFQQHTGFVRIIFVFSRDPARLRTMAASNPFGISGHNPSAWMRALQEISLFGFDLRI